MADFEVGVVDPEVRVEEALAALIHRKKGQVQPRKKNKRKRKNHHQRAL